MDSVNALESVELDSTRLDCESEVLNLESKFCLDSKFALHSALGLLEILGLRVRFKCCARRGARSYLSGSD